MKIFTQSVSGDHVNRRWKFMKAKDFDTKFDEGILLFDKPSDPGQEVFHKTAVHVMKSKLAHSIPLHNVSITALT
jgi:hypothetical protein